jgi:DNA-directed RNA polymerase subunit H (RpoH/RPB5)
MSRNPFGNLGNIMKQAQAMQEQMAKIQEQAGSKQVSGTAGGGIVTVTRRSSSRATPTCCRIWSRPQPTTPCAKPAR